MRATRRMGRVEAEVNGFGEFSPHIVPELTGELFLQIDIYEMGEGCEPGDHRCTVGGLFGLVPDSHVDGEMPDADDGDELVVYADDYDPLGLELVV